MTRWLRTTFCPARCSSQARMGHTHAMGTYPERASAGSISSTYWSFCCCEAHAKHHMHEVQEMQGRTGHALIAGHAGLAAPLTCCSAHTAPHSSSSPPPSGLPPMTLPSKSLYSFCRPTSQFSAHTPHWSIPTWPLVWYNLPAGQRTEQGVPPCCCSPRVCQSRSSVPGRASAVSWELWPGHDLS